MFLNNIKLLSILIGNSGQEQTHAAKPKFKGSCFVSCKSPDLDIEKKKKLQKLNIKYQNKIKRKQFVIDTLDKQTFCNGFH